MLILRHAYYPDDPRVRREVAALAARGHAVQVVCLRGDGERWRERVADADVLRLPIAHRRAGIGRYVWEYGLSIGSMAVVAAVLHARRRFDLVQVNTMPDALAFAALGPKLAGVPVLLDLHEVTPELFASKFDVPLEHPWPRLLARIEQAAIRFADAALAVSAPCRERYVERGARRSKLTTVMNCADPQLFRRPATPQKRPPGPPRVVSHGTLVRRYGFDVLLRALSDIPEAKLTIIGDGEARPALERLADQLGIAERVTFTGRVPLDEIPARLLRADVGVVANRSDPFTDLVVPTKLMEYAALGLPAVVARTPAARHYFDPQAVAYFVPGDPTDLARALRDVLADPSRGSAMVAYADRTFNHHHGWPATARRYVALVEQLAVGR